MAQLPYEALKEFYANAVGHKRGQALLATAREYLDEFVFNFDVKDAEPFHIVYKDGQLVVNKGRGQAGPGKVTIDSEISAADMSDLIEGEARGGRCAGKKESVSAGSRRDMGSSPSTLFLLLGINDQGRAGYRGLREGQELSAMAVMQADPGRTKTFLYNMHGGWRI